MPAPSKPGIYVATLRSSDLVPVTRDVRYVATCAHVNCLNVKIGKAQDLSKRERDYWNDFDKENVIFRPVAITPRIQAAERVALRALRGYRKPSPKGGKMDWLEGITVDAAIAKILEALKSHGIPHEQP